MPSIDLQAVQHPTHYTWLPNIECISVTKHFNFQLGNVIKYVWRAGFKSSASRLEDLNKALQYLKLEIADEESKHA